MRGDLVAVAAGVVAAALVVLALPTHRHLADHVRVTQGPAHRDLVQVSEEAGRLCREQLQLCRDLRTQLLDSEVAERLCQEAQRLCDRVRAALGDMVQ